MIRKRKLCSVMATCDRLTVVKSVNSVLSYVEVCDSYSSFTVIAASSNRFRQDEGRDECAQTTKSLNS